ncbi:hypothetical protein WJX77_001427 [Trebouxia sp. C0004]
MTNTARYHLKNEAHLIIHKGDITQWEGDAIVNAANGRMLGGGGVDGAIHRAAGPGLLQACGRYPDILNERCPTGDARVTLAYELPCRWIIHTVGPIYNSKKSRESHAQLYSAYMSSLAVANGVGATTIAFPAISCGIYGYPLQAACTAALQACFENSGDLKEVHFVLFGSDTYDVWLAAADKHLKPVTVNDGIAQQANTDASASSPTSSDEASPMHGTTSQDASLAIHAAGSPQRSSASKDGSARDVAATDESSKEETSVQTLTGVKEGEASEPAQEALAVPEVLEAAEPATNADLPGHSPEQGCQTKKGKDGHDSAQADADVGMLSASPDTKTVSK